MRCPIHGTIPYASGTGDECPKCRAERGGWIECVHCGEKFRYVIWTGHGDPSRECMACQTPNARWHRQQKIARGE
jgi:hypothetical protein